MTPTFPIEGTPIGTGDTYSSNADVIQVLGAVGQRLPTWIVLADFRRMAFAEIRDRLATIYPTKLPAFTGAGLYSVGWAEAKLAAAEILEALRVNLPDLGDAPERLRASVEQTLEAGIIGYPVGSTTVPGGAGADVAASRSPKVSSFTPVSAFPDPYAEIRGSFEDL